MVRVEAASDLRVIRSSRVESAGGFQPKHATTGGGDADKAAKIGGMRDRDHTGRNGSCGTTGAAAGVSAGFHGFKVGPLNVGSHTKSPAGVLLFPSSTSPAARQRATRALSGLGNASAKKRLENVVGMSEVKTLTSFTRNGTPANGPVTKPSLIDFDAFSKFLMTTAFRVGFSRSIRVDCGVQNVARVQFLLCRRCPSSTPSIDAYSAGVISVQLTANCSVEWFGDEKITTLLGAAIAAAARSCWSPSTIDSRRSLTSSARASRE